MRRRLLFITVILFLFSALLQAQNAGVTFWDDLPNEELARKITDQMTDTELFSQILMFGWAGEEPENILYEWVNRGLGSVKVFGWNTNDIHLVANQFLRCRHKHSRIVLRFLFLLQQIRKAALSVM